MSNHAEYIVTDRLEQVAQLVNEVCRSATFDLAFRIGQLIIEELYGGNLGEWRKHGTSRPSYRALAARRDLLLSPSALCRSVGVYVLTERLGGRQRWRHLSVSHLKEVLPLPECEQERMLELAERGEWTVAELRQRLPSARVRGGERSSASALLRTVRRLQAQAGDCVRELQAVDGALLVAERLELERLVAALEGQLASLHRLARGDELASPHPAD